MKQNFKHNKNIMAFLHRRLGLFLWMVIIPFLLTAIYICLIAKDRYISQSMVVVKKATEVTAGGGGLTALLGGLGASNSEDAHFLQAYILSYDMLQKMDKTLGLRKAYADSGWDLLQRLPEDATREDFLDYYRRHVRVEFDDKTSLLTITTDGFTPKFALAFNKAILSESERFINELSHRVARDQMKDAHNELDQAYARLNSDKQKLLAYQNKNGMLDPTANAEAASKVIAEMEARLAQMQAEQRNLLTYLNPDAPQVLAMKNGIDSLQTQISAEKSKLTSPEGNKLNSKAAQFQELKARVEFDADIYKLALTAIEKIRVEAASKLKNLVVVTSPPLAEKPEYPHQFYVLGTTLVVLLLGFGVLRLVVAIIEDHKE